MDGWRHWLSRLRSNRFAWVLVTGYFLFMDAGLIAASDGTWPMSSFAGWLALAVLLLHAAIELWSHVLPDETQTHDLPAEEPR